ncbi:MAG TPA: RNA polymerase sigma factor [Rudaea sp.]|jgi:RNA polymerase sigma factor (sigma-70 family)|nr:RNA polymerase sigma factor [Rudaea sp.]
MGATDIQRTVSAVWRIESARLVGAVARMVGGVGMAEEFAQDALLAAMEQWPRDGIPDNPAAWLMTAAKRRAIDHLRRGDLIDRKHAEFARHTPDAHHDADNDTPVDDDRLRLIFIACHPVVPAEGRIALTLRLLGGLTTQEIARAFLSTESTIAQRIVRAKKTLADAHVPFEAPSSDAIAERLPAVLEVVYLIFNEGYSATAGSQLLRPELCEEALRLGRTLAQLLPHKAEVSGLAALMELQASRLRARVDASGAPVLLADQDRSRWDRLLIRRGLIALARALRLSTQRGRYVLQAEIAACHARSLSVDATDWRRVAELYWELLDIDPSPVVELNRAMAVAMAYGAEAGLVIVDHLRGEPALQDYALLAGARGDLLERLGRHDEARTEFERAGALSSNEKEREPMLARARKQPANALVASNRSARIPQ